MCQTHLKLLNSSSKFSTRQLLRRNAIEQQSRPARTIHMRTVYCIRIRTRLGFGLRFLLYATDMALVCSPLTVTSLLLVLLLYLALLPSGSECVRGVCMICHCAATEACLPRQRPCTKVYCIHLFLTEVQNRNTAAAGKSDVLGSLRWETAKLLGQLSWSVVVTDFSISLSIIIANARDECMHALFP